MKNATKYTDTVIDARTGRRAALEKKWIVSPTETTSIELDHIAKHKSESDPSKQSNSPSSPLVADSDLVENTNRAVLDYYLNLVNEMLRTIDNTVLTSGVVPTDSSTRILDYHSRDCEAQSVKNEIERLFSMATFVDLESGMTNDFSDGLVKAIESYGVVALEHIQELVLDENIPFTIAAEVMRYIGNIESGGYVEARRKTLESCLLNSRYMLVRDGAAAGISYIDDSKSIPCLQRAIKQEKHSELKKDLQEVLRLLQDKSAE